MDTRAFSKARALRAICALAVLAAASGAYAQSLQVTAANASNDSIYNVTFNDQNGTGSITVLNNDGSRLHSLQSLTFVTNTTPPFDQVDLLAADNQGGIIVRYVGDFQNGGSQTGTQVFPRTGVTGGPTNPDGLSVDGFGDVFVVNSSSGTSTAAQVWELAFDPSDPTGLTLLNTTLIDGTSFGAKTTLEDTMVASGASAVVQPGDLLVLKSDPSGSAVLDYPGQGSAVNLPPQNAGPTVLINLPTGVQPGGMAFWQVAVPTTPLGGGQAVPFGTPALLVTTGTGDILQYSLATNPATQLTNFNAASLGNGQFKIKTGTLSGVPYAFIADNNNGRIIQFSAAGAVLATATAGVQHPQGLAVNTATYQQLATCASKNGCDAIGGSVLKLNSALNGNAGQSNLLGDVCVVQFDPRTIDPKNPGSCYYEDLPASQVCGAAFDNPPGNGNRHVTIPSWACGTPGFALVKTLSQAYSPQNAGTFNGLVVGSVPNAPAILAAGDETFAACLPPGGGLPPLAVFLWAPFANEGGKPAEGPYMMDINNSCTTGHGLSTGISEWGIGFQLNANSNGNGHIPPLVNNQVNPAYVDQEFGALLGTLSGEVSAGVFAQPQPAAAALAQTLQQCTATSQDLFDTGAANVANNKKAASLVLAGAATQLLVVDEDVETGLADFTFNATYPNPSGSLRQRVEHLYYEINTRVLLNTPFPGDVMPPPPYSPPPPTITNPPPKKTNVGVGSNFSYTPAGEDFAGQEFPGPGHSASLTYSVAVLPSWAQPLNPATGTITGIAQPKGQYPIQMTVTDGCASSTINFTIQVN